MNRLESIKVYAAHHESAHEPNKNNVWTISEDPDTEGWETDSGYSGYGLPKDKAEYYAKCINEHATLLQRLERYETVLNKCIELGECQLDYGGAIDCLDKIVTLAEEALKDETHT